MRRKKRNSKPFVMVDKNMIKTKEWKELKNSSKLIYIYIKANYNGKNCEKISFKYNCFKDEFSSRTISEALKELIAKGWIKKTQHGGLYRYYCTYSLTGNIDPLCDFK